MTENEEQAVEQPADEQELAAAVEPYIPTAAELEVLDGRDRHEVMVRMDDHDVRMLLERVQSSALRKWVYELRQDADPARWPRGLTVHAVQDITQFMNWTGACKIGVLPDTLSVEQTTADEGNGPEPFWVATIFARDEMTGAVWAGSSMEPQRMRLKTETAEKRRRRGQKIPEDNTIFDRFARTKAIQKAQRNAVGAFIPEVVEQTVIAMFANDPKRVERIETHEERVMEALPAPLTDERAVEQIARARSIYDEIRELGAGRGKLEVTPALFNQYLTRSAHDHDRLDDMIAWLQTRRDEIAAKYEEK
jgi:hypothetical protein